MGMLADIDQRLCVDSAHDAANLFAPHLNGLREEKLMAAHLAHDRRLLKLTIMSDNARDSICPSFRQIITDALSCNATGLIIAHNHPSGIFLPSPADKAMTRLLVRTLRPIGIRLHDHLIFGRDNWSSFTRLGFL
jgi:DNA repair protein RadC